MEIQSVDVAILGAGTAGSNAAKAAIKAGAKQVVMIHPQQLINTCVEEGCMPSKSILAGAHQGQSLDDILETRDAHIIRLLSALTEGFANGSFSEVVGTAKLTSEHTVEVISEETTVVFDAKSIVIATGSTPFIPPIPGLDTLGDKVLISDDIVSRHAQFSAVPKRVLTIGGGPIGLEMSTFFHDMGANVTVLQRGRALSAFDPEFGDERVRASQDPHSFPIILNAELQNTKDSTAGIICTIQCGDRQYEETYDAILVATGRRANIANIGLDAAGIERDEKGRPIINQEMRTSVPHIFMAGDVVGNHQILHFAAEMGKVAGHNAVSSEKKTMDYDRHMLAVSFDQFPSALIGLTETEARKRGIDVVTATKPFNSIGLGILKRQEYGLWKLVADRSSGKIVGSQVLGPDSAGELIQVLTPIIYNGNTYGDILEMTWYHPTYAEILQSLARDLCQEDGRWCPGM